MSDTSVPDTPRVIDGPSYSKGYAAGMRRKARDNSYRTTEIKKNAFWQRAFLAALPAAFEAQGWKRGEVPIATLKDRVRLAGEMADEAVTLALPKL